MALEGVFTALDEFLAERMAAPLGPDQKAQSRLGVNHLKQALIEAGLPIKEFVQQDGLAPYIARLEKRVSLLYVEHLKDIWRQILRHLCRKKMLALSFELCPIPAEEVDPYQPDMVERGFPESWIGIYCRSIMPKHTARAIRENAEVPALIGKEYRLVVQNRPECRRDATRAVYWFQVRQLARDLKIQSFKELASEEGAKRLMAYFQKQQYTQNANVIRKIRGIFNSLQSLGLMDNPFHLKHLVGEVKVWVIDFSRLPETTSKQKFLRVNGKRHTRVDGELVECRLRDEDIRKIAAYGNPALADWKSRPPGELRDAFKEAQENLIGRTVLVHPPRPMELWALNWKGWGPLEGDEHGAYAVLYNNARGHKRKRRPDRVVPAAFIRELEKLFELRQAAFAPLANPDAKESFKSGMKLSGIPLLVHPKTGGRLSPLCIKRALRAALIRMGIKRERAEHATLYWVRKGHITFTRNHSGGLGDKHLATQDGHSERILVKDYDGPEKMARAEHFLAYTWGPLGMAPTPKTPQAPDGHATSPSRATEHLQADELFSLAEELAKGGTNGSSLDAPTSADRERRLVQAMLKTGLLCTFQEAAAMLDVDIRTLERWEEERILRGFRLEGRRHLLKAQVRELANCLSPEEVGKQLKCSGRQVRNLIHDGRIKGAISQGKKFLIPLASVRAYENGLKMD